MAFPPAARPKLISGNDALAPLLVVPGLFFVPANVQENTMFLSSDWINRFTLFCSAILLTLSLGAHAEIGEPEKDELTFGFIKLTDMAPIAVA